MVASANGDLYTPFPRGMILEEGPQSSEEGSGLHSPVFGAPFPPRGDSCKLFCYRRLFNISLLPSIKSGINMINLTSNMPRAFSLPNLTTLRL